MPEEKIDFQKTLNLPKTAFDMRANLAQKEPKILEQWEKSGLYGKLREGMKGRKPWILHDGPPYANGNIHIGHALNKILKDFIVKSKTMQGFDTHYVPGWDCHGLPIEHQLLKEMKKRKSEVDCVDFRKKAHEYAMKYVGIQRGEFKRLGVFGDWDDPYLTLTKDYEYWILKSLSAMVKAGYVYRGLKPVNWCPQCETALAEAEVEYADHQSPTVFVKFRVNNASVLAGLPEKPLNLVIWTTTPWTLMANVAVAVHPAFTYSVIELDGELVILEKTLAAGIMAKLGVEEFSAVRELSGRELEALTYDHPFGMVDSGKVVTADYVTKEDGTGLVHTAPGHGQDDFETGKKHGLPVIMPVNDRGVYTEEAGAFAGQFVFKANPGIIEALKAAGTLLHSEPLQHSYPHCWRCKNPVIFRATDQWFVSIDHNGLRGKLKDIVRGSVKWVPPSGEERIMGMVALRPDWCLSRQRYWGVPIPAVKLKGDGHHPELHAEVIDHFAEIVRKEGTDAWFEKDIKDLLPPAFAGKPYEKTHDILDVWFDSGVSHQAVIKSKMGRPLPAQMYLEGSDQHRGWFQSSLIPGVAIEGRAPFEEVLTHGFVVDGAGRKMSKSLGNVVSPQEIIQQSGADILRLWVCSSSYNEDIRVSKEILERMVDGYRKIRNTFRYLLGNLYDFAPDTETLAYDRLLELDKWALGRLAAAVTAIRAAFNEYEFSKVYKTAYAFCNEELSNIYLDILKDRLYISAANSPERKSAQTVLFHILNHLVRVLAPVITFTAEEIFHNMPKTEDMRAVESVHMLRWLDVPDQWRQAEIEEHFKLLLELRPHVMRTLEDRRSEGLIGSSLDAKVIFNTASERDYEYLASFGEGLADYFVVSQALVRKTQSVASAVGGEFPKTEIAVEKADGKKCSRSWKYSLDVGQDPDFPTLSLRSAQIVKEILHAKP